MTATHAPVLQESRPARRALVDWLSVSRLTSSDGEINALKVALEALVREHAGYGETVEMKSSGNFGQAFQFKRFGAQISFTKRTQALLNDWDEQGRCVGWINFTARGSTGIGSLGVLQATSLVASLAELGFDVARRVDCTVDVFNHHELTVELIKSKLERQEWRIPRRQASSISYFGPLINPGRESRPSTLYLGSKDSPTRVTVYDKAAQLRQRGQELPEGESIIRFECRCTGEGAPWALRKLLEAADSAFAQGCALEVMDRALVGIVRGSADIKDVSAFNDIHNLPKNWIRSPLTVMPAVLAPVFQEIAPLQISELRLKGGFASRVRHMQRSSGKTLWQLCLLSMAQGVDPGPVALGVAAGSYARMTPEDFEELARAQNIAPADLEQAEVDLINLVCKTFGYDETILFSDKQAVRAELAARLGGV